MEPRTATTAVSAPARARTTPRRALYAAAGIGCVGIGGVGVFVPGLPTTIWLMAASFLFARSSPQLEATLIRNRFFGPYLAYLDRPAQMPRRAKITATLLMWASVSVSLSLLAVRGTLAPWLAAVVPAAALVGTWFIWRFRQAG